MRSSSRRHRKKPCASRGGIEILGLPESWQLARCSLKSKCENRKTRTLKAPCSALMKAISTSVDTSKLHGCLSLLLLRFLKHHTPANGSTGAWGVMAHYRVGILKAMSSTGFHRKFTGPGRPAAHNTLNCLLLAAVKYPKSLCGNSFLWALSQNITSFTTSHKWLRPEASSWQCFNGSLVRMKQSWGEPPAPNPHLTSCWHPGLTWRRARALKHKLQPHLQLWPCFVRRLPSKQKLKPSSKKKIITPWQLALHQK